jgi:hypothetical protein
LEGVTIHPATSSKPMPNGMLVVPNAIAEQVANNCEEDMAVEKGEL